MTHPTPTDPASEAVSALREAPTRSWSGMVEAIAKRCGLAVAFDQHVGWDTDGADALGKLLREMATRLDGAHDTVAAAEADIAALRTERDEARATLQSELDAIDLALAEGCGTDSPRAALVADWIGRCHAADEEVAALRTLEAELAVSRAEVARLGSALPIAMAFLDKAAGEGFLFVEDEENGTPEMDAGDLYFEIARRLGHDPEAPEMLAMSMTGHAAARALNPEGASDHG